MKIVLIGAGNLATRLSLEMHRAGMRIGQVYSHTRQSAETLAKQLGCGWTVTIEEVQPDADLYVFSLKDAVLPDVLSQLKPNAGLWVHTAGSVPMDVFKGYNTRYGVLYPLQTFSKKREVNFNMIPFFIEAGTVEDLAVLRRIGRALSENVQPLSSEKRKIVHLSAVFACNFTNHMYALAAKLLEEHAIPFETLLPLIDETAAKVHAMSPQEAQTGPAMRYDENVIHNHIDMLSSPDMKALYESISKSIHKEVSEK